MATKKATIKKSATKKPIAAKKTVSKNTISKKSSTKNVATKKSTSKTKSKPKMAQPTPPPKIPSRNTGKPVINPATGKGITRNLEGNPLFRRPVNAGDIIDNQMASQAFMKRRTGSRFPRGFGGGGFRARADRPNLS